MKRTLTFAMGFLVLGVAAYCAGQLSAQNTAQPAPGQPTSVPLLRNKIAVFNMSEVIKGYKRWQEFEQQRNSGLKDQQGKFDKFKLEIGNKQADLAKLSPTDTAGRDKIERDIRLIERQAGDLRDEIGKQYQKWEQDQITLIYKEIESVAADIARAYNVELILHYTDPVTPEEKYHPMNLARKLQSSGITPIFMAGGIDISKWMLDNLNRRYEAIGKAPTTGGTPAKQP